MGQAKGEKGQKSCENLQSLSRCLYYATLQLDLCTLAEFSHCDWVINLKGSTRFLKPLSHITQAIKFSYVRGCVKSLSRS